MTSPAKDSTSGATMLAAVIIGNLHAARAFGLDEPALRRAAKITDAMLADPDGRVPIERQTALWEAIADDPRAIAFGLWLGKSLTIEALGVVGYVMQHAPDVRSALYSLERFNGLLGDGVGPNITERGEQVILHRIEPPRVARLQALSIAAPIGTITLLRQLSGESAPFAIEAAFQHPPLPDEHLPELRALLGCPIHFNDAETRLVLPRALLDRPLRAQNRGLFEYLERHAASLQERVRSSSSIASRVRELLMAKLRDGEPEQGAVAKALGLSERTLQRRLSDEQTSFAQLLDEVRTELARMYLADDKLAIFEVAFLLGYSEPSAFNRAFRRWTGKTPSEFRAR